MVYTALILPIALLYAALLFALAFFCDRRAQSGRPGWLKSPIVYTLAISIYCSSWTFYGAVGSAARNGLEYAAIYLGPSLVFVGWWALLRKLVRIGHVHGVTSIADMISSRFGKHAPLAALVTLVVIAAVSPYIALQLRAVTTAYQVIVSAGPENPSGVPNAAPDFHAAFWIAAGMALFAILFGTRNVDAKEQHHGVVAAIALEAVVKLIALLAVGGLALYGLSDGVADIFKRATPALLRTPDDFGERWGTITLLAACASVCLPRQFQVTVVENTDERHLRTASWLFPLYLLLLTASVLPITVCGLSLLPKGVNPDMFVLTLPMWAGHENIATLAFLGGCSSATSMVIVSCIALSTMISNHLVMPLAVRFRWVPQNAGEGLRRFLLLVRRLGVALVLTLGYGYFRLTGAGDALAATGLIAFAGVAQLAPALLAGLYWRGANAAGAMAGIAAGTATWVYTLFLPSFGAGAVWSAAAMRDGPFGLAWLRPQALFGLTDLDPLVHSIFWSLSLNVLALVAGSLLRSPKPIERLQAALFVDVFRTPANAGSGVIRRVAPAGDLRALAQRILGAAEADRFFAQAARQQGLPGDTPLADAAFISGLERRLASSIGAAMARALISEAVTVETISLDDLMRIADETRLLAQHSLQLEEKSRQLEAAAAQLREANARLMRLDEEKDDFLSQVSHEVRTPMTAIRSFSEILLEDRGLDAERAQRYLRIIHDETVRLTRLLDSTLDLGLLERGVVNWPRTRIDPEASLDNAMHIGRGIGGERVPIVEAHRARGVLTDANADRLCQVFINLISNAIKFNTDPRPRVSVSSAVRGGVYEVLISDNGPGIPEGLRARLFSGPLGGNDRPHSEANGAGLGLAISWQIMRHLGGTLELVSADGPGACFRVALPLADAVPPAPG